MTKWRAPDGRVFDESEIDSYVMEDYFSEEDFEEKLDEWFKPLDVGGHLILPSEIIRKLRPYMFSEMYEEELDYYAEDPELLGFEEVSESGNKRASTSKTRSSSKCVKKKPSTAKPKTQSSKCLKKTAASKPKSNHKTTSNQRKSSSKPRSGTTSGKKPVRRY